MKTTGPSSSKQIVAPNFSPTFLFMTFNGPLDSVHLKKVHKELYVKQFKEQFEWRRLKCVGESYDLS